MLEDYYRQYGLIAIFTGIAIFVPLSMIVLSSALAKLGIRPQRPNPVKEEIYECGMDALGGQWAQFNFRYYLYALLFVIFDVAVIFIYPWATRLGTLGLFALIQMIVFLLIIGFGWIYAWRKHDLEWR